MRVVAQGRADRKLLLARRKVLTMQFSFTAWFQLSISDVLDEDIVVNESRYTCCKTAAASLYWLEIVDSFRGSKYRCA